MGSKLDVLIWNGNAVKRKREKKTEQVLQNQKKKKKNEKRRWRKSKKRRNKRKRQENAEKEEIPDKWYNVEVIIQFNKGDTGTIKKLAII